MRTETPQAIRLADYRPPAFLIDEVELDFALDPTATRVRARLHMRRNGEHEDPLRLMGERLRHIAASLDGRELGQDEVQIEAGELVITNVPDAFVLETEVEIDPQGNKALDGLYMSGGRFCTQCEAEGFRKITWYLDRPDVLARFTVRVEAPKDYERLLSNGNRIEAGELEAGRHYAIWRDPFPKPCYLFALVAGELDLFEDELETMSGRKVALQIYVDPGMAPRAAYAMDALKRSMIWDEETFGREYDLDLFMIVAVRDFNFGAMENKGLNIFNASLLLADPETATDFDFERIESVVAHEYFHNWTGNRITCRDWFQLCLKEGLTVFRDQQFSADMRGEAVQRIKDVRALRARQFTEDQGPLAHPVRPSSYLKIDNFYTATIYEKGAEVIRVLRTLLGAEQFRKGMDLYFARWDGHATTVEAFIDCFAETSGQDLSDFFAWYEQAGTPRLSAKRSHDGGDVLEIEFSQVTPATPGQADKRALPVPIRFGLVDPDGAPLSFTFDGERREEAVFVLRDQSARIRLEGVPSDACLSVLRGFSAPVVLSTDAQPRERYALLASDPDLFNRWEAGQELARALMMTRASGAPDELGEERFAEALGRALADQAASPAYKALMLGLPGEAELALAMEEADPTAIHEAREALRLRLAVHLEDDLRKAHISLQQQKDFSPDAESAGARALRNAAIDLLAANPRSETRELARAHYQAATNMTDAIGGLSALMLIGGAAYEQALADFYERWKSEPLVIDKWFALQARDPSESAVGRVLALTAHPAFDQKNPNRLRALVSTFASANPVRFHEPSGAGYRFLADQILAVDGFNPMTAARLIEPLGGWRRFKPELGALMRAQLERIVATEGLSKNVYELATRALGDGD